MLVVGGLGWRGPPPGRPPPQQRGFEATGGFLNYTPEEAAAVAAITRWIDTDTKDLAATWR
jgi:hypothetical protein